MIRGALVVGASSLFAIGVHAQEASEIDDSTADEVSNGGETVVTTATRSPRPVEEVPASTVVLPKKEIERSPTLTTDELLRTVPEVQTFRRSSSLVADPSSQGLNLRGLGPSGASRSLVLVDGVPANDPFGGWVYWRALPRLGMQQIEIVPSGGSALWGSDALGGVVQIVSRPIAPGQLDADLAFGSQSTLVGALRGADRVRLNDDGMGVGASIEAEGIKSDGYPLVASADRGAIDQLTAPSVDGNLDGTVSFDISHDVEVKARVGGFREIQSGGTTFTDADVTLGHADVALHAGTDELGAVDAVVFGVAEQFDQTRARIAQGRASESLAATQRVPADAEGASVAWTSAPQWVLGAHELTLGVDGRRVAGEALESIHPPTSTPLARASGGEEDLGGVFAGTSSAFGDFLDVTTALRLDAWRNADGHRTVDRGNHSAVVDTTFPDRTATELSPRVGVLVKPFEPVRLRASIYHAFRAPTLNELYRPFQVGTVLTDANANLGPETLWGSELGGELGDGPVTVHVVGFWNALTNPIINATVAAPLPDGATRQRQNLGEAFVRGFDAGADWRLTRAWTFLLAYTFVDSSVVSGPRSLIGKQLAQDPQQRATAILTFDDPRLFTATVEMRALGPQYEDDLNTLPIPGFVLFDGSLARRLPLETLGIHTGGYDVDVYAAVDNALDSEVIVGRAGVDTIGEPFMIRGGLRFRGL